MLRPNPEGFLCKLERNEKEEVWKDVFSNCYLVGIRTETRAASRMHFYGFGIWVNVPKGRYDTFFHEQCDRRSFESRNLIPLTRDWITCDSRE